MIFEKEEERVYNSGYDFFEKNVELVKSVLPNFNTEMLEEYGFEDIFCDYDFIRKVLEQDDKNYYHIAEIPDGEGYFIISKMKIDYLMLANKFTKNSENEIQQEELCGE